MPDFGFGPCPKNMYFGGQMVCLQGGIMEEWRFVDDEKCLV
jgi:hypothetical protein